MPQVTIRRPFGELDLCNQLRPEPHTFVHDQYANKSGNNFKFPSPAMAWYGWLMSPGSMAALVRILVAALSGYVACAIRSVGNGFILAWKSIRSIIPKPIKDEIKSNLGAVGFIGGAAAIYAGFEIMGYQMPWWVGLFPLFIGIVLVVAVPFYAGFFFHSSLPFKYMASVVLLVLVSAVVLASVINTPPHLRPFINELGSIENSAYRRLVAETIYSFDPAADIQVGGAKIGPDGVRQIDVAVRSRINELPTLTIIDVVDLPSGNQVGIEVIDAIDSKRTDLKADFAIVCSNTGFDKSAIRKAKRVNVGLISVLRQGDKRIRGVIEQEIYLRRVYIEPVTIEFTGATVADKEILKQMRTPHDLRYDGKSVADWLQFKAGMIALANPTVKERLRATYNLKKATNFDMNGQTVALTALTIRFQPRVQWLSQVVQLDATAGIYDYVRGRVRMGPGKNSYTIRGVNFDKAVPLAGPPEISNFGVGLKPGEIDMFLVSMEKLNLSGSPMPQLEGLVRPEDLTTRIQR